MAQIETAADRYRRLKTERAVQQDLVDFTSPSGMQWKLRRPDLQQFIASGVMPIDLAVKVAAQQQAGVTDNEQIAATLSPDEMVKSIEFMGRLVRYCAVSPRIVERPKQGEDEIGYDEVEIDDFYAIVKWAKGGGEAESLNTFPG